MASKTKRQAAWQGSKWCRPERRLAIYLRDGLACVWCGHSVEQGAQLSLDHLTPHAHGGGNETSNLVTACKRCNSSRGDRSVADFAAAVAGYLNHGIKAEEIESQIAACAARPLDVSIAKEMINRRGTAAKVLAAMAG